MHQIVDLATGGSSPLGLAMDKEIKKILSNRQKSRLPKMGKYWCGKCDAYKVGCGEKCPNCGFKERIRDKK